MTQTIVSNYGTIIGMATQSGTIGAQQEEAHLTKVMAFGVQDNGKRTKEAKQKT